MDGVLRARGWRQREAGWALKQEELTAMTYQWLLAKSLSHRGHEGKQAAVLSMAACKLLCIVVGKYAALANAMHNESSCGKIVLPDIQACVWEVDASSLADVQEALEETGQTQRLACVCGNVPATA